MYGEDVISLVFILSLVAAFLLNRYLRHKERLMMLEKGVLIPDGPKGGKNYFFARLGFVIFGLFSGIFIEEYFMSGFTLWLGGALAGLGLLISYFVYPVESASDPFVFDASKQHRQEDESLPKTPPAAAPKAEPKASDQTLPEKAAEPAEKTSLSADDASETLPASDPSAFPKPQPPQNA